MPNRSQDWLRQAERDLEQAEDSRTAGRHEWACFIAQQAAEKAVKALHLKCGQMAYGHVIVRLLKELPEQVAVTADLTDKARVLDSHYYSSRFHFAFLKGRRATIMESCRPHMQLDMPVRLWISSVFQYSSCHSPENGNPD